MTGEEELTENPFPEDSLEHTIAKGIGVPIMRAIIKTTSDIYNQTGIAVQITYAYKFDPREVVRIADYIRNSTNPADQFYLFDNNKKEEDDNGQ